MTGDSRTRPGTRDGAIPAIRSTASSDVGVVRTHNEDSYYPAQPHDGPVFGQDRGLLYVVADGMGGAVGGEMASSLVVRTLYDAYMANQTDPIPTVLGDAVLAANSRIYEYGISRPELRGMGSTCTALVVRGTDAWFAHVGDSRLYLVRDNRILQLTDDHSKVAQMVRDGQMTEAEAEESTQRNVLQRALGPKAEVQVDVSPRPIVLQDRDRLVLCSDGLTAHVRDSEILEIVNEKPIVPAVAALIELAKHRGGTDNITVQVISLGSARPSGKPPTTQVGQMLPTLQGVFPAAGAATTRRGPRGRKLALAVGLLVLVGLVGLVAGVLLGRSAGDGAGAAPPTADDESIVSPDASGSKAARPGGVASPAHTKPSRPADSEKAAEEPAPKTPAAPGASTGVPKATDDELGCLEKLATRAKLSNDKLPPCEPAVQQFLKKMCDDQLCKTTDAHARLVRLAQRNGGLTAATGSDGPWLSALILDIKRYQETLNKAKPSPGLTVDGCPLDRTMDAAGIDVQKVCNSGGGAGRAGQRSVPAPPATPKTPTAAKPPATPKTPTAARPPATASPPPRPTSKDGTPPRGAAGGSAAADAKQQPPASELPPTKPGQTPVDTPPSVP